MKFCGECGAELAGRQGDANARRSLLSESHAGFVAIGATACAEQIASEQ